MARLYDVVLTLRDNQLKGLVLFLDALNSRTYRPRHSINGRVRPLKEKLNGLKKAVKNALHRFAERLCA